MIIGDQFLCQDLVGYCAEISSIAFSPKSQNTIFTSQDSIKGLWMAEAWRQISNHPLVLLIYDLI